MTLIATPIMAIATMSYQSFSQPIIEDLPVDGVFICIKGVPWRLGGLVYKIVLLRVQPCFCDSRSLSVETRQMKVQNIFPLCYKAVIHDNIKSK